MRSDAPCGGRTAVARLFHFSYQRYLENQTREVYDLTGTPVRMIIRERGGKDADK